MLQAYITSYKHGAFITIILKGILSKLTNALTIIKRHAEIFFLSLTSCADVAGGVWSPCDAIDGRPVVAKPGHRLAGYSDVKYDHL